MLTSCRPRLRALALTLGLGLALVARAAVAQDDEPDDDLHRPERLTVGVADDLLGQLSPDGQTLYFVSNRNTTNQLFAQTIADGRAHLLFDDDADVTWPRVSPDGTLLLYISFGERASGQLCVRHLPDGEGRRCLQDGSTALQAEWIDRGRIALVSRESVQGDLRVLDVSVDSKLTAGPLLDRNLTSPAVSPDGRWLVYVPVERSAESVGPAFAARAAPRLEAVRLDGSRVTAKIELDLPGQTGQPVFARDGRSLYVVQFFSDSNHDGVIDASDHGILFRVPIAFTGDAPVLGTPEQLTETSWNCEYPAPTTTRLVATCSQDQGLDVYALPLDGEVPAEWTTEQLGAAIELAPSRVAQQLLASRRLARETTTSARRLAMLGLALLHLELEEYRAAEFYAEHIAAMRDPATAGVAHPVLTLVAQRRAARNRERGKTIDSFGVEARERLEQLQPKPTASPMAVALSHVVRSEIADSIGQKTQARTELEAAVLDETTPAPIIDAYYQRADALYRGLDDREALVGACRALSQNRGLPAEEQLRYARAAARAMVRGLGSADADARVARERAAAPDGGELAFALDLARVVLTIRKDVDPSSASQGLLALYAQQERADRRRALLAEAVRRADQVGADAVVEALAQRNIDQVKPGTRERPAAERLYRRVLTSRAYRHLSEKRFDEARADFDAIVAQTRSFEAVVGAIDVRLHVGERPEAIEASYAKATPALARFAEAYLIARQLPKLDGEAHAKAADEALAALRASWSELKPKRIAQALDGALLHEEYLRTGELASAEKANVHYLVALELVAGNPRFRALILGQLGLLQTQVGNYRIALGYLVDRDKLPYADNSEGLAVHLAEARALLHVGKEDDAAAKADEAVAMVERNPALAPYRVLSLDRAAMANLAAGRFARGLSLYDQEVPLLDVAAGPAATRNRFVTRLARAASALGAGQPARALEDLADVDRRLADPAFVATLHWAHATTDHVVRSYRLILTGLRAHAERALGRFDAEAAALEERRTILDARLAETHRPEIERDVMLTEAQLALSANDRHDAAATGVWLTRALARADDLHARARGVAERAQLDVLVLAAQLTIETGRAGAAAGAAAGAGAGAGAGTGTPLVPDLPRRLAAASTEVAERREREPALREYERWFEVDVPLVGPTLSVP